MEWLSIYLGNKKISRVWICISLMNHSVALYHIEFHKLPIYFPGWFTQTISYYLEMKFHFCGNLFLSIKLRILSFWKKPSLSEIGIKIIQIFTSNKWFKCFSNDSSVFQIIQFNDNLLAIDQNLFHNTKKKCICPSLFVKRLSSGIGLI